MPRRTLTRIRHSEPSLIFGFFAPFERSINGFADKFRALLFADQGIDTLGDTLAEAYDRRLQLEWRTSHDRALSDITYLVEQEQ
jgi:hypothetical protein